MNFKYDDLMKYDESNDALKKMFKFISDILKRWSLKSFSIYNNL